MNRLEDIGFYTLSDDRARNTSPTSPMWRCELILTDRCNFKCGYCRGLKQNLRGDIPLEMAKSVLDMWTGDGLKNVRFSGGEPTLYPGLIELVGYCSGKVKRIAISTNGSASIEKYKELVRLGVNDFSISLDACCSADASRMAGCKVRYSNILDAIAFCSKNTYTTVGIVLNENNCSSIGETVRLAASLGVNDIRVISSAQSSHTLVGLRIPDIPQYPILTYRLGNIGKGKCVRGITHGSNNRCPLVMDDSAVANGYHFPCIIYLREGGEPMGMVGDNMRMERVKWAKEHNTHSDPICSRNCLDVCVEYNDVVRRNQMGLDLNA